MRQSWRGGVGGGEWKGVGGAGVVVFGWLLVLLVVLGGEKGNGKIWTSFTGS